MFIVRNGTVLVSKAIKGRVEQVLVRREDESFEVREVGSALGFIQSRPHRAPEGSFEISKVGSRVAGEPSFILKNAATERFLVLSEPETFLWEQMDGNTSLQEIATAYVLKYGEFDFDIIPNLIRKLQRAQLLTLEPKSRLRQALARNRRQRVAKAVETTLAGLERIRVSSRKVQPFVQRLHRWGGFLLFTRAALPQLVHALACVHYRRRVREFGFALLHGFLPTFYVDVTDIFMASRRARVVTAVSGTLVHLVLGAVWFLVAAQAPVGSFTQAFAAASGIIQWQALAIALYPFCFVEMDGYHVFVDLLGVPTLKHDALSYVKALLGGRARLRWRRLEGLWLAYVVLSALSVAAFFAFNVWIVVRATS